MSKKLFLPLWVIGSLLLFLYSYTQVDLSLTLSQASIFQSIQKSFQYIGWFNRPLSSILYLLVFLLLFCLYFWTLRLIKQKKIGTKAVWITILTVTGITVLSYNAFSYDLFNYIFDARIVTFYNENPYAHKALDYPGDPMLSFMRWTHRVYPYGPLWLALTVPVSFIGGQIFSITFFLFKFLIGAFFLLTAWSIGKVADRLKLSNPILLVAAFALNPFVVSESLVSSHNDIVMMGILIFAINLILKGKVVKGSVMFAISVGIKFATALVLLAFFILWGTKKKDHFLTVSLLMMIVAVILATMRTTFQPWYLLYIAPFAALLSERAYVRIPFIAVSIGAILYYVPFLYTGNWDPPVPQILNMILLAMVFVAVASSAIAFYFSKNKKA